MKKLQLNKFCPYCGKACGDKDEYVITRRGTQQYFHGKCFLEECVRNERTENTTRRN